MLGPLLEVQMWIKCTPFWRQAHLESKSENYHMPAPRLDDLLATLGRKRARRCGAKHILKPTVAKQIRLGPHLEVEMSKKCTPLWREAHLKVNM